jgi:hypothetical protein
MTRRRPLFRVLLSSHLPFVAVLWVLFTVAVLLIVGVVALSTPGQPDSIWHHAATQVPRWLMFGLGIDAVTTYLRLQLAHGGTRRAYFAQTTRYAVVLSGASAMLITLGYLLERGVYALLDWPQRLSGLSLFDTSGQYHVILGTYWLTFLMWTVAGTLIALGFFRFNRGGLLTIPIGVLLVVPAMLAVSDNGFPLLKRDLMGIELSTGVLLGTFAGCFAVGIALIWAIVRDVPMKPATE